MGKLSKLIGDEVKQILDMSEEARMARAKEMGFDTDNVYHHGSRSQFDEFDEGRKKDIGFHFGDKAQASAFVKDESQIGDYYLKMQNPIELDFDPTIVDPEKYIHHNFNFYDDMTDRVLENAGIYRPQLYDEIRSGNKIAEDLIDSARRADYKIKDIMSDLENERDVFGLPETEKFWVNMERYLSDKGYDSMRYLNQLEGNLGVDNYSVAVFKPNQIRSKKATFDPAKKDSSNLMASVAPAGIGLGSMLKPDQAQAAQNPYPGTLSAYPTGEMRAPIHPLAATAGRYFDQYNRSIKDTPLEYVLPEAPTEWADKLAYDGKTRISDRIKAALGLL